MSGAVVLYVLAVVLLLAPFIVLALAKNEGTAWFAVFMVWFCWPAGVVVGVVGDYVRRRQKERASRE